MKLSTIILVVGGTLLLASSCSPYRSLEKGLYTDIKTDKGNILLELSYDQTPITVANFVSLAEGKNENVTDSLKGKPYYDGIKFHRVMANFMIQGGDPTGTGSGGPGYVFDSEFPNDEEGNLIFKHDTSGILSMANAGPGTNGSQFFITHKATPWLDGKHTIFGHLIKGQEVVDSIQQNDQIVEMNIVRRGWNAKMFKAGKIFAAYMTELELEKAAKEERMMKLVSEVKTKMDADRAQAKTLPSGLKIKILESKDGVKPKNGDKVLVEYAGYFVDGKLFDSNIEEVAKRYEVFDPQRASQKGYSPMVVSYGPEARLIAGFKEGLQQLSIGDKALLFLPSNLAYGEKGAGNVIPPNAELIFMIKLVDFKKE